MYFRKLKAPDNSGFQDSVNLTYCFKVNKGATSRSINSMRVYDASEYGIFNGRDVYEMVNIVRFNVYLN